MEDLYQHSEGLVPNFTTSSHLLTHSIGMVNWSKHFKHENPTFSPTFRRIVEEMAKCVLLSAASTISHLVRHFGVEVQATRLNFYADGSAWKPFHHDSHAYGADGKKEDFTMGTFSPL